MFKKLGNGGSGSLMEVSALLLKIEEDSHAHKPDASLLQGLDYQNKTKPNN
jgi:hypothetical protein